MAELRIEKTLLNGRFTVRLTTQNFTDQETKLLAEFGEPTIDIGGELVGTGDMPVGTLDSEIRKVKSGLNGLTKNFTTESFENPKEAANAWIKLMTDRLRTAMNILNSNYDDFSGNVIEPL